MNYELAKQLKDAGFPQGYGKYICEHGGHEVGTRFCGEEYYTPTLSELIEACGDEFNNLFRESGNGWRVNYKDYDDGDYDDYAFTSEASGSTPEEAVANLWLELNKK